MQCGILRAQAGVTLGPLHTPSTAFRHLPPNSARFSYATERGTLYLRAAVHRRGQRPPKGSGTNHTPSIAFRHLPPNSARFSYATEGAFFISAQLSTDAVSALRKVRVLITLRASLSGTFLQRKDVVNQCLEFGY